MPASSSSPSFSSPQHLGPMVHTILVLRTVSEGRITFSSPILVLQKLMVWSPTYPVGFIRLAASSPMTIVLNDVESTPVPTIMGLASDPSTTMTWSLSRSPRSSLAMPSARMVWYTAGMTSSEEAPALCSMSMGTRLDTTLHCAATEGLEVTTTTGTGGLYLDSSAAGSSVLVKTTMAMAPMSRHAFTAELVTASRGDTGLGVLFQMLEKVMSPSRPTSAFAAMAAIVATAFSGNAPLAVSPESIVASAPSHTAFATSVISARVGRGFSHMDSSIWVAQITNLPAMLHLVIIIFCASATFSEGISMPRSPRATITPSVYLRMSSMLDTPSSFSILEMIWMLAPPLSSRILRTILTSSPVCTNDTAM
mmetsp:Transcript_19420/g.48537  ORF Transcript_19420/g.48537 Transcript_19420/m.48537 type:complete len:366 (-) Transcript_19420:508-1605(-)